MSPADFPMRAAVSVSHFNMKYLDEIIRSMNYLAADNRTLFIGQAVLVPGTIMSPTLVNIHPGKRIELPVAEEMQMGISLGLALTGIIPVSIFPRWNFMLLAIGQLVNHLDKISEMSEGGYRPKVIIRTGIGSRSPLNPGPQHLGDYTDAMRLMLTNIEVIRLDHPDWIFPAYEKALNRTDGKSTIVVEYGDLCK
jgi:pyruvate/2-oxoglutarate/acetoin dehydrogenase E1 component